MKYGTVIDVAGRSYVVRCDERGMPQTVAPARDAGDAERMAKDLNDGKAKELDAILAETGKEDSAWALIWCFILAVGTLVVFGLWKLAEWIF